MTRMVLNTLGAHRVCLSTVWRDISGNDIRQVKILDNSYSFKYLKTFERCTNRVGIHRRKGTAVGDLIDTTEMYLKTIFEMEEDGVTPCVHASLNDLITQVRPFRRPLLAWNATDFCTF